MLLYYGSIVYYPYISSLAYSIEITNDSRESKSPEGRNNRLHCKTERRRRRNMYRVFDTSGSLLTSERTAKKKMKKGTEPTERGRDRAGEKKRRWYRSSNEHTTQNTRVFPREMVRGDAIRYDVFLAPRNRRYIQCVLYIRRVSLLVRPITT